MSLSISKAAVEDIPDVLALQKIAYLSEARLLGNYKIQPLMQTLGELESEYDNSLILKGVVEGNERRIIGSVRARKDASTVFVGKLMVHPEFQRKGFGSALLTSIESFLPASRYELFTSSESKSNLTLYHNLGYKEFKREQHPSGVELVFLEKLMTNDL